MPPLLEDDGEEICSPKLIMEDFLNGGTRVSNLKIRQQESGTELRSPSPEKANIAHITNLLDDDDDHCFCIDNMQKMMMSRQKSKTEYTKRQIEHKDSHVSTINEVDQTAEDGSVTNNSLGNSMHQLQHRPSMD